MQTGARQKVREIDRGSLAWLLIEGVKSVFVLLCCASATWWFRDGRVGVAAACSSAAVFKFVDRFLEGKEEAHSIENRRTAAEYPQRTPDRPTFSHRFTKQQLFVVGQVFLANGAPFPRKMTAQTSADPDEHEAVEGAAEEEVWCIPVDRVWDALEKSLEVLGLDADLMPESREEFETWLAGQWHPARGETSVLIGHEDFLGTLLRLLEDNEAFRLLEEAENVVRTESPGSMKVSMLRKLLGPSFLRNLDGKS
eukprot:Polyplicarium_translucidae@DN1899_c0_g1_i2.p1